MAARSPEEICNLFRQYMAEGDLEALLNVYDPEVVFLNKAGEARTGQLELRQELAPFAAARARFDFNIKQVIQAGEIALMQTEWKISWPQETSLYAMEVCASPAGWHMVLAYRRSVHRRQTGDCGNAAAGK